MQKGFSTLFIVIILGSITLSLALAISTSSLWSIQDSLVLKRAVIARSISNACAEVVLETMRQNNTYTGSDSISLGGHNCTYTVSDLGGSNRNILVTTLISDVENKIEIKTDNFNPLNIVSWQEIN